MARLTPCDTAELQRRYDGAVAAGCGVLLDRNGERILACDGLLAATMPYHARLAVLTAGAALDRRRCDGWWRACCARRT